MSVKFRKGRWEVDRKWRDGTRFRKRMPSQDLAEKIDLRIKVSNFDGTWRKLRANLQDGPRKVLTFARFSEIYLKEYVATHNRSKENKQGRINCLVPTFGKMRLDNIRLKDIATHERRRVSEGVCNATINRDLSVLCHMLRWGARNGYVARKRILWIEEIDKLTEFPEERRKVSEEILDAIFAKLDPRVKPLFTFIRETGCRREEGLSLRHDQIDRGRMEVTFTAQSKSGKPRTVPLEKDALEAIDSMPVCSRFVFYHPESLTRWDECRKPWIKARVEAGYPWVLIKDMRRAYAIRLAESGCSMHMLQNVLGHSSVTVTEKHYARFSPRSASDHIRGHIRLIKSKAS